MHFVVWYTLNSLTIHSPNVQRAMYSALAPMVKQSWTQLGTFTNFLARRILMEKTLHAYLLSRLCARPYTSQFSSRSHGVLQDLTDLWTRHQFLDEKASSGLTELISLIYHNLLRHGVCTRKSGRALNSCTFVGVTRGKRWSDAPVYLLEYEAGA